MRTLWATLLLYYLLPVAWSSCKDGPMKVFLLAGQSNMAGRGSVDHLKSLLNNSKTRDPYLPFWNEATGTLAQRKDVYCTFQNLSQPLVAGGCSLQNLNMGKAFGPEMGIGWEIGDAMSEECGPIFLIKAAYGGRNMAVDFRPPSSGSGRFAVREHSPGWIYRQMLSDLRGHLANLTHLEAYDPKRGYELTGLFWFQGYNDYVKDKYVEEYDFNLANFVEDIRADLNEPNLPILIGGVGWFGNDTSKEKYVRFQEIQKSVTKMYHNMLYVPTFEFAYLGENDKEIFETWFHYKGRADTFTGIGRAFGKGMLKLIGWDGKTTKVAR